MSIIRDNFIKTIESLPYNIDDEIKKRDTIEILRDITQRYIKEYGTEDLCESDKEFIKTFMEDDA